MSLFSSDWAGAYLTCILSTGSELHKLVLLFCTRLHPLCLLSSIEQRAPWPGFELAQDFGWLLMKTNVNDSHFANKQCGKHNQTGTVGRVAAEWKNTCFAHTQNPRFGFWSLQFCLKVRDEMMELLRESKTQ